MIEIFKSILYGIIQGITEWLPISSTGHLIILNELLPLKVYADAAANTEFLNMYMVVIQFGSALAVVWLYFKDLFPWGFGKTRKQTMETFRLWLLIVVSSIPIGIIGVLFDDYIDKYLYGVVIVAIALIVYGILFIIIEKGEKKNKVNSMEELKVSDGIKVGLFECLALIPGTSRSGSTILGSRILGIERKTAAKFSFFLALPPMAGAFLLKIVKMEAAFNPYSILILAIGTVTAFVISLFVIRELMDYIRSHSFASFGVYRIILGIILLVFHFVF